MVTRSNLPTRHGIPIGHLPSAYVLSPRITSSTRSRSLTTNTVLRSDAIMTVRIITSKSPSFQKSVYQRRTLIIPIVQVIISTPVQLFMAWRIKIIAESVIPSIVIGLFSLASLGKIL